MEKHKKKETKIDLIRELLLKTVEKNPDLFCYYISILEAKELLGNIQCNPVAIKQVMKPNKTLASG